jgi:large subunit ribosomal protein L13
MAEAPEKALLFAVKGMLPKNKLASRQITRLRVFKNAAHPHAAQFAKPAPKEAKAAS